MAPHDDTADGQAKARVGVNPDAVPNVINEQVHAECDEEFIDIEPSVMPSAESERVQAVPLENVPEMDETSAASDAEQASEPIEAQPEPVEAPQSEPAEAPADVMSVSDEAVADELVATQPAAGAEGEAEVPAVIDVQPLPNSPAFEAESFVETVESAERDLADERRIYNKKVAAAKSEVKKAQSRHDAAVRKAEKELDRLIASYSSKVASFAEVVLYRDRVTYRGEIMMLDSSVSAYCEATGGIRSIPKATSPSGEILERPDKNAIIDERELTMFIESGDTAFEVPCNPDKGEEASRFVNRLLEVAEGAEDRELEKQKRVEEAERGIEELEQDTSEIDEMKEVLAEIEGQTEGIAQAQRRLQQLERNATGVEAEALADSRRRARMRKLLIRVLAVLVVIIVVAALIMCNRGQG